MNATDRESFGDRLRRLRLAKGWRQSDLAAHAGVGRATVAHWEAETRWPRADYLERVADTLGCDMGWLFTGRGWGGRERA